MIADVGVTWTREVPAEWEAQLRQLSPITTYCSHLRFRWHPAQRWMLYECLPKRFVGPSRRRLLDDKPWWELPPSQQYGRRTTVSTFEYLTYHRHGVWPKAFLVLQGESGVTPCGYTPQQIEWLRLAQLPSDPPDVGQLAYAAFDNRTLAAIESRDRLRTLNMSVRRLRLSGTPAQQRIEEAEAERAQRKAFLAWWFQLMAPGADFLTWYTQKTASDRQLRPATVAETNAALQYEDHFIEHGTLPTLATA